MARSTAAIHGGSDDLALGMRTRDQRRRDAVGLALPSRCTATLITPRLAVTAWHCVRGTMPWAVTFGPSYSQYTSTGLPPAALVPYLAANPGFPYSVSVPVVDCIPHPDARGDGAVPVCGGGGDRDRDFDVALLVLEERVDFPRTSNYAAEPAEVYLGPDPPDIVVCGPPDGTCQHLSGWTGVGVLLAGYGGIQSSHDDSDLLFPTVRQRGVTEVAARSDSDTFYFSDYVGRGGDSGAPYALATGDGTYGSEPMTILSTHQGPWTVLSTFGRGVKLNGRDVRPWLERCLDGTTAAGVYLGPTDVPARYEAGRLREHWLDDPDGDGLVGAHDNCPLLYNPEQRDLVPADGIGEVVTTCTDPRTGALVTVDCTSPDTDGDGVFDPCDNCFLYNPGQEDCDRNGLGDRCEGPDADGDGVPPACDNCPGVPNGAQENCNADIGVLSPRVRTLIWTREVTYRDPADPRDAFGCNASGSCPPLHGDLNSHYWSGEVQARYGVRAPFPALPPFLPGAFLPQEPCPMCAGAFPIPYVPKPLCLLPPCPAEPPIFARVEGVDLDISAAFDPLARSLLGDPSLVWVAPAEPGSLLSPGSARLVAVDLTAMTAVAALFDLDGTLVAIPPGGGGQLPPPPTDNPTEALRLGGVEDVGGPALLLSGNGRALFLVGGSGGDGAAAPILTRIDLLTGAQQAVAIRGARPGEVIASALHARRRAALVLDRLHRRHHDTIRFLWVELDTGLSTLLGSFPAVGAFSGHMLAATPDGGFVLAANGRSGNRYAMALLDASAAGLSVDGFLFGRGALEGPIAASQLGVTAPVQQRGAPTWTAIGYRYSELLPPHRSPLGGCF